MQIRESSSGGWALIAYQELLTHDRPQILLVIKSCSMLAAFGLVFLALDTARFQKLEYAR